MEIISIVIIVFIIVILVFCGEAIMSSMRKKNTTRVHRRRETLHNKKVNENKPEDKETNVSRKDAKTFLRIIELLEKIYQD